MNKVELLIPAKDLSSGKVAINHGADALYIGATKFGARQAAGNSLSDLDQLVQYAHLYGSKVYVTLNTLLYDEELMEAQQMIHQLYNMGIDALIIQDLGILKMDLPPISLHASTQCHNDSLERVQFLQKAGFKRAILAREMDVETIRSIHEQCDMELETFIHGALCVCYSGQCYMSEMMTGRSGNRGECAQICRTCFDLVDAKGRTLVRDKHLLSLRDMNRSAYLNDLMKAGVTSFKVEGRLKDENYVKNITAYYRQLLDAALVGRTDVEKAGSGQTTFFFSPNPKKTFNRGFTPYFVDGKREKMASFETPKAMGQWIGGLKKDRQGRLLYDGKETIVNGDGLCFVNDDGELEGFFVNGVQGNQLLAQKPLSDFRQVDLYRNVDKMFEKVLSEKSSERKIMVDILFKEVADGFELIMRDEDGCEAVAQLQVDKVPANKPEVAESQWRTSLGKLGNTPFQLRNLDIESDIYFLQASVLNKMKGEAVETLCQVREQHFWPQDTVLEYAPEPLLDTASYKRNIINEWHRAVYQDFGATTSEDGLDKSHEFKGKEVMECKYCIRYEMGACSKQKGAQKLNLPLYIKNDKYRFRLEFDCKQCRMKIVY